MKYYTFKRESNNFDDILSDTGIKQSISTKIAWLEHLLIGMKLDTPDSVLGYLVLKYGDEMVHLAAQDFTPKPDIDYTPKTD